LRSATLDRGEQAFERRQHPTGDRSREAEAPTESRIPDDVDRHRVERLGGHPGEPRDDAVEEREIFGELAELRRRGISGEAE
jgi:hypothetical protein